MRKSYASTILVALAAAAFTYACSDDEITAEGPETLDDAGTKSPARDAALDDSDPADSGPSTDGGRSDAGGGDVVDAGDAGDAGDASVTPPPRVVVVRAGELDGGTLGPLAAQIFLDEYDVTSSAHVRTIALPTVESGDHRAVVQTAAAVPVHEGAISRSADGHAVVVTGYPAFYAESVPPFVVMGPNISSRPRVVARVNADGGIDTTTLLSDSFAPTDIGGAALAGNDVWIAGSPGGPVGPVQHLRFRNSVGGGATGGNDIIPPEQAYYALRVFAGRLYGSTREGKIVQIGSGGLPNVGPQTTTPLVEDATGAFEFELLDLDATPGADRLYVAVDGEGADAGAPGGIRRYDYNATELRWDLTATFTDGFSAGARGLAAHEEGASVVIVATTTEGDKLVRLVDTGAATATTTTIATAPAGVIYRGVTNSPLP